MSKASHRCQFCLSALNLSFMTCPMIKRQGSLNSSSLLCGMKLIVSGKILQKEETSLPGSSVLAWQSPAVHLTCSPVPSSCSTCSSSRPWLLQCMVVSMTQDLAASPASCSRLGQVYRRVPPVRYLPKTVFSRTLEHRFLASFIRGISRKSLWHGSRETSVIHEALVCIF